MSEMEELTRLYEEIEEDGFFPSEWSFATAVGDIRDLEALAEVEGKTVAEVHASLADFLGAVIDLCGEPVSKGSRVERLREAWASAKKRRDTTDYFPRTVKAREKLGLPCTESHHLGTF